MLKPHRTILIVDDFPPDRELYRRYLLDDVEFSYQILEAESASDALDLSQTEHIDGILLDFLLPDLDGLEFLAELKTQKNGNCPPVIIITAQGNMAVAVKAIKSGAEDYLVKGEIRPEDLRQAVSCAIEKVYLRRELQASEERFRISVENMLDCFGIYSSIRDNLGKIIDFRIDYLNPAAMKSNRMTEEDIGKKLCEILPVHFESGLFDSYCQVVETGQPLIKESLIYTDVFGTEILTRAYDIHVSKLSDGIVISWRDITEKKQTEIALQESERKFKAIFNSAYQFIGLLNTDGILLETNQSSLDFGGIKREDAINRPFWEAKWWTISQETQEQLKQAIACASSGSFVRYEVDIWGANNSVITIDFSLQPVKDENGHVVLIIPEGRDISEQKIILAQLQSSQNFIQRIAETSPGILYVYDLIEQRNVYVNRQITEILGYTKAQVEAMGTNLLSALLHPDDFANTPAHLELLNSAKDGDVVEREYRMQHVSGEWRWFLGRETVFSRNADGKPSQILGISQDITSNKRTQAELFSAVEKFELAAAAVNCLIYDWDVEKGTVDRTEGLTRLVGYTLEEADPSVEWWGNQIHPEDWQKMIQEGLYAAFARTNKHSSSTEYRVRHKDGHYIWVEDRSIIIHSPDGKPIRMVGSTADITERKLAEAALQESESLFRGIFDSDLIGIVLWNSQGQIINANNAFIKMTGYTRSEMQAGEIYYKNITPPEYHESDAQKIQILYENGKYQPFEKEYICKDGSRIPILIGCAFLPGYQDRGVAFCLDITEKKRSEQERERLLAETQAAREEAVIANQTKDEFLAVVSHELRSPLNSILGWAKLLQNRPFEQATAKRALETIERNAKSQSQLIEDLLDISRMIKGNLRLELAPVNLIDVIQASIEMISPTALTKQINIEFLQKNELNLDFTVSGDFGRLQQVVVNLLTNAVKFTPNEGQVEIELSHSKTPTLKHSEYSYSAIIKVQDTGKGIPPDFLPYVFERFRQARNSSKAKEGLGLGLAIVRNLVELHDGTVTAASLGKDQGATFTVILPLIGNGE